MYYLQPTADHVSIYKVTLGKRYVSQFARIKAAAKAGFVADGTDASRRRAQVTLGGPIAPLEAISVTRDTIMNNTVQMNNYRWYYSLNSWDYYYIPVDTNKVTRPTWLSYTMTGDYVTAIPYAWGGFDTDVTHSTNTSWLDYGDAMSKDRFAGNINTSTGGYQSGTAGVDCSGYVGRAWTLTAYKRNDKQIVDSFGVEIAKTSIGPGDAADWYGHHILILGDWYDPASSGIMTKEANVTPPESGKVDYRTWDYFTANGYKFYKYKNLL
ncbi:MAG: hypothetical protein M1325_00995 [Actinobacteria bacterium]|nr:hypothetical protein [Actinomycetota bacterium]